MKRIGIFLWMFILFLPDLPWCLKNLVEGGMYYLFGSLMEVMGFKKSGGKIKLYGRNIALSIDQFGATKAMGQDSDVSISMALGVAREMYESGKAKVAKFWLLFGNFVDWLFAFDPEHIKNAIEREEKATGTVIDLYVRIEDEADKEKKAA